MVLSGRFTWALISAGASPLGMPDKDHETMRFKAEGDHYRHAISVAAIFN
jgi:hypothetical protein